MATSIVNLHLQCRRNNSLRDRYEYISSGHITHTHPEITNDPQQLISQLGLANSYHSLKLQSSYATILGKEPELTNYTDHYQGCLDYIWVTKDFIQPIGYLAGIKGVEPAAEKFDGDGFDEEMIVMHNFTNKTIDSLIKALNKCGVGRVPLKAVITPTSKDWDSLTLIKALKADHEEMLKKLKMKS